MLDFRLLEQQQLKAVEVLKKMIDGQGTPNIEYQSWVVGNPPSRDFASGLPEPINAHLWFDTMSGNWVCFCGNFWNHGTKPHLPKVGSELIKHGWKECGFAINSSFSVDVNEPPDRAKSFKSYMGDYLEFETDGELFWFDITPKNMENNTLQTVALGKKEFRAMVEYLANVCKWL